MPHTSIPTRHADLGSGTKPRNPYKRDELVGIDIFPIDDQPGARFCQANVALAPIPFPDNHFDSVSAYDFLEHVPRVLPVAGEDRLRFPFVELMNEIWRVLKPDGLFYAQTPAIPHAAAFQDPTHVNFITDRTHEYFTQPLRMATQYGYVGDFSMLRSKRIRPGPDYHPTTQSVNEGIRNWIRLRKGKCSHLLWEFRAIKSPA